MSHVLANFMNLLTGERFPGAAAGASVLSRAPAGHGRDGRRPVRDFSGFLRALVATGDGASGGRRARVAGKDHAVIGRAANRSTRRRRALSRIGGLALRGELRPRDLQNLPREEWRKLEDWVLAGAGGAYAPAAPESGETPADPDDGDGSPQVGDAAAATGDGQAALPGAAGGRETGVATASAHEPDGGYAREAGKARNEPLLSVDSAGELLDLITELLAAVAGGGDPDVDGRIIDDGAAAPPAGDGPAAFLDTLDAASRRHLAADLLARLLPGDEAGGELATGAESAGDDNTAQARVLRESGLLARLEERIAAMSAGELAGELGPALGDAVAASTQGAPSELRDGWPCLQDLPLAVLRSLVAKVLAVGEETPADSAAGAANRLLALLDANDGLRERLLARMRQAEEAVKASRAGGGEADIAGGASGDKLVPHAARRGQQYQHAVVPDPEAAGLRSTAQRVSAPGADAGGVISVIADAVGSEGGLSAFREIREAAGSSAVPLADAVGLASFSGRSSVSAQVPSPPQSMPAAQVLENIERVAQVMRMSVSRGISHVSLQLSPADLGQVTLRLRLQGGVLTANVETQSVDARQLLGAGLQQLRDNLQVHGIELESFDVYLAGGQAGEGQDGSWPRPGRRSWAARRAAGDVDEDDAVAAPALTGAADWSHGGGGLDYVV